MKDVEEEGTMESTTLLSKQTKVSIVPEVKEEKPETENQQIAQEKG